MMDHNDIREIAIITESSMQSSMLKDTLEEKLDVHISLFSVNHLSDEMATHRDIIADTVIVDLSHFSQEKREIYHTCRNLYFNHAAEVLINCPDDTNISQLMAWSNLNGVFYVSDDIDMLIQGVDKILQGELWFSRKLAQEYIMFYRQKNKVKPSPGLNKLTKREQQIITLLGNGDSNTQIADKLFVSENTVKTHLHNVFKKINARNRLQALIWVKENIIE
ncbi:LuxR C-terminal-related transcriptional regulator [Vibrio sp. HN007]|uniref:LuxR C-terminal-related transcriptional regulator n=1 Tax=Vibrio iocasae TaxID=3098914 RepID=UPI0035D4C737